MNRLPLRYSLLGGMVTLTAIALVVAGVISVVALRAYLLTHTDEQLRAAAVVAERRDGALMTLASGGVLRAAIAPTEYVVEVRRPDGEVTRVSGPDALPVGRLLRELAPPPADGSVSMPMTTDGSRYRAIDVRIPAGTLMIALPLQPEHQILRQLVVVELSAGVVVLIVLTGFAWLLLNHGMRPLTQITATAAAIADGDLDRRVPAPPGPRTRRTEVGRLTLAVNGMMTRIESALSARAASEERMRRFVADASHELRTPLTSIRGYLQMLGQGIVTLERRPDVLRRVEQEAARMASLVDDLLYLARLDAEPALRREPVDLSVVVRDSLSDALAVQPGRPATLETPPSAVVLGDPDALRQVMANLLANVRVHTAADDPVRVSLRRVDGLARVEVADRGPGVPPDVARHAFERFRRGPASGSAGGTGLGLAIVAEIVAAHGGRAHMHSEPGAGTTVSFTLPLADP